MTTENSKNQDNERLQERVSDLEFEVFRRLVIDRVRPVIMDLSDDDYEPVPEAIAKALIELGVPHEECTVHVMDGDLLTDTQHSRNTDGWTQVTTKDISLVRHFHDESAPVYRPDLLSDDPFGEAHWAMCRTPPVRSAIDVSWSHGTLSANSTEPNAFQSRDIETLAMLAEVLSEAFVRVEDLQLLKKQNQELREQTRLANVSQEIARTTLSSLDTNRVLDRLAEHIVSAGIFRSLAISLPDYESNHITLVRSLRRISDGSIVRRYPDGLGKAVDLESKDILAETVRTGEMQVAVEWDDRFAGARSPDLYRGQVAYFIPVQTGEKVAAVLATGSTTDEKEETLAKIKGFGFLLNQLAVALEHAELYRYAQLEATDPGHYGWAEHRDARG